jgi:hypothetical protein
VELHKILHLVPATCSHYKCTSSIHDACAHHEVLIDVLQTCTVRVALAGACNACLYNAHGLNARVRIHNLCNLLLIINRQDLQGALAAYMQALELDPTNTDVYIKVYHRMTYRNMYDFHQRGTARLILAFELCHHVSWCASRQ